MAGELDHSMSCFMEALVNGKPPQKDTWKTLLLEDHFSLYGWTVLVVPGKPLYFLFSDPFAASSAVWCCPGPQMGHDPKMSMSSWLLSRHPLTISPADHEIVEQTSKPLTSKPPTPPSPTPKPTLGVGYPQMA